MEEDERTYEVNTLYHNVNVEENVLCIKVLTFEGQLPLSKSLGLWDIKTGEAVLLSFPLPCRTLRVLNWTFS